MLMLPLLLVSSPHVLVSGGVLVLVLLPLSLLRLVPLLRAEAAQEAALVAVVRHGAKR